MLLDTLIDTEVEFIHTKFLSNKDYTGTKAMKAKIKQILEYHQKDLMDFSFIVYQRSHEYQPDLTPQDIWKIAQLDEEFVKMHKVKTKIKENLRKINGVLNQKELDFLDNWTVKQIELTPLLDMEKYIHYLSQIQGENVSSEYSTSQNPIQKSKNSQILEMSRLYSLEVYLFIQKLEISDPDEPYFKWIMPPTPEEDPAVVAEKYLNPLYFKETLQILYESCRFLANELSIHPCIKELLRTKMFPHITISTNPTELGKKELDYFNVDYRCKRILRKPIEQFDDDLFMSLLECRKRRLIELIIDIPKEIVQGLIHKLDEAYCDNQPENHWNICRSETIKLLVNEFLVPQLREEVENYLIEKAKECILDKISNKFGKMLMMPPYRSNIQNESRIGIIMIQRTVPAVMAVTFDRERQLSGAVVVDQSGELLTHRIYQYICKIDCLLAKDKKMHKEEVDSLTETIQQYKPTLIVIGANDILIRDLKNIIEDHCVEQAKGLEIKPQVIYGELDVLKVFSLYPSDDLLESSYDPLIKSSISLARYKQNPIAEILNLWDEDPQQNNCLKLNLHPFQHCISKERIVAALEMEAQKCVNAVGVDINKVYHKHTQNIIPFLSGLGPRKATYLIEKLKQFGGLHSRAQLVSQDILGKTMFFNLAPFLNISDGLEYFSATGKINDMNDILDATRIHPEFYPLAKKLAKNTSSLKDKDDYFYIQTCLLDPNLLSNTDLNKIEDLRQRLLLQEIKKELAFPFKDPRGRHTDIDNRDLFYMLTNEDPTRFYKGMIVTAKTVECNDDNVKCSLNNGLEAYLSVNDIFEEYEMHNLNEMRKRFSKGYIFQGRLKEINESELIANLTVRPSEMRSHKAFKPILNLDTYFTVITEEDDKNYKYVEEVREESQIFSKRDIKHEKFKNFDYLTAIKYLEDKRVGDFIFRPAGHKLDTLYLSFKFYSGCYSNIIISEENKPSPTALGKRLILMKEEYFSLEEIVTWFCIRSQEIINQVSSHKKFVESKSVIEFEKVLKKARESNLNNIVFNVTILPNYPQYFVLGYIQVDLEVNLEYIKLRPKGLFFHYNHFKSIDSLILYFKENVHSAEYKRYVNNSKTPQYAKMRVERQIKTAEHGKTDKLVLEKKRDQHDSWSQSVSWEGSSTDWNEDKRRCFYCKQSGHLAKDCRLSKGRMCFTCKQFGHLAKDCHFNKCFICNKLGHFARDCPSSKSKQLSKSN